MDSLLNLENKIAVVTGGASGIGESISKAFADAGAQVCVLDVDDEGGKRVIGEISADGFKAIYSQVDVSDQQEMVHAIDRLKHRCGRIDILVNNAGIAQIGKLETTSEEDFDRIFAVNVKGVYNGMYAAIPHMKRQRSGVILNMGSIAAELGLPDRFAYSMSKGAVLNMTLTVARDYLEYNIRCNSIAPARIHTPFVDTYLKENYPGKEKEMYETLAKTQPIGRMGTPQEVANLALYLCSDAAGFITGTNYLLDGGFIKLNT